MRLFPASLLALTVGLAAAAGAQVGDGAAEIARARVLELIRADDTAAALAACRAYNAGHRFDFPMLYNEACLEARSGLPDEALAGLRDLVTHGFDDIEHMATDPDLAPLAGDPRFGALLTEIRTRLLLQSTERGGRLLVGRPTGLYLGTDRPSPLSSLPEISLEWRPEALVLELPETPLPAAEDQDRPAVVVTLGLPDADAPYLTRNAFVFACGRGAKGRDWGAVWVPTLGRWQQVAELAPRPGRGNRPATVAIPWALIQPLHPLVDGTLGFNVTFDWRISPDHPGYVLSVVRDGNAFDPAAATRRVVRLDFDPSGYGQPALLGRLDDSIVTDGVLDFEVVAVCPAAGRGSLEIDFLDNQGRSVLPAGPVRGALDLAGGRQGLPRQASFAGLPTGSYQLRAELAFPDGGSAVWGTPILNLAPGWEDSLTARSGRVAPADRRTADHFLAAVRAALAAHLPRRHPGPIATTLGDLDAMLARAAATGSILPAAGPGLLVYAGPDGGDRLLTVLRPRPGAARGPETPVLVLGDAPGDEDLLAGLLARFYEHGDLSGAGDRHPLYLVPHLPAGRDAREAAAALAFVRDRFAAGAVAVVGIDGGAGVALQLAADGPDRPGALMILAADRLEPWPGTAPAELAGRLGALPRGLPVDWTGFAARSAGADRAAAVLAGLEAAGADLVLRRASGPLGPSQAADRIVLWAEQLPVPGGE